MTWLPLTDLHASLDLASAALPLAAGLPEPLAGGGSLWALLGAVLLTSLLGSIHCVGMCGPLVVSAATPLGASRAGVLGAQLLYHAGRLATLGLLGALAGALGAGVSDLGQLLGFQRAAAILTGVALLGWGGFLLWRGGGAGFHLALPGAAAVGRAFQAVGSWPPARRALLLGALTPLLPCGWLYLFVIPAAGSGSASSGALVLLAFGLGSVPALLGVALAFRETFGRFRERLQKITAVLLILTGALLLAQRGNLELPTGVAAKTLPTVEEQERLPCCGADSGPISSAATADLGSEAAGNDE